VVVAENGAAGWAGIVEDGRGRPSLHRFETGDDSKRARDARRYIDSKRAGTPVAALRWRMEAVSSIK